MLWIESIHGDLYHIQGSYLYDMITCTPNHKFLTQDGWVRADRLLAGNIKIMNPHRLKIPMTLFEKKYDNIDLCNYVKLYGDQTLNIFDDKIQIVTSWQSANKHGKYDSLANKKCYPVNRYLTLDDEFRYLIGRWLGDGSVTRYKNQHSGVVQIVFNKTTEKEAAYYIAKVGERIFGIAPSVQETNQNIIAVRWSSQILYDFFISEFGEKCDGKYLKDKYLGDFEIAKGLLDADSSINTHGGVIIVLKNYGLIKWLKETLFLNGCNTNEIKKGNYEGHYMLSISTYVGKGRLNKHLKKTYHDKRNNLTEIRDLFSNYATIDKIFIEENIQTKVYNISVEDVHSYTINGIIAHNCYVISPPEDNIESIFDCAKNLARTFSFGGRMWDRHFQTCT